MWLEKHNVSGRCNPVRMSICHTTFIIGAQTLDIVNQSQECWEKMRGASDLLDYIDISWTCTRNEIGMGQMATKLYQNNSLPTNYHLFKTSRKLSLWTDFFGCL